LRRSNSHQGQPGRLTMSTSGSPRALAEAAACRISAGQGKSGILEVFLELFCAVAGREYAQSATKYVAFKVKTRRVFIVRSAAIHPPIRVGC
jgi:hypothetical protein